MPNLEIIGQFVNHISILHLLDLPLHFVTPFTAKTFSEKQVLVNDTITDKGVS